MNNLWNNTHGEYRKDKKKINKTWFVFFYFLGAHLKNVSNSVHYHLFSSLPELTFHVLMISDAEKQKSSDKSYLPQLCCDVATLANHKIINSLTLWSLSPSHLKISSFDFFDFLLIVFYMDYFVLSKVSFCYSLSLKLPITIQLQKRLFNKLF